MDELPGNQRHRKAEPPKKPEPKIVEKVTTEEVRIKRKGLGSKFKEVFAGDDAKNVVTYVIGDVILPAVRNAIVDATTKGIERMIYGDRAPKRPGFIPTTGSTSRVTYSRSLEQDPRSRSRPMGPHYQVDAPPQRGRDFLFRSRAEAETVLESMFTILSQYEAVTLADLKDLMGQPQAYTDNDWGWLFLAGVTVRQIRDGFILDLPPEEPIR